MAACSGVSWRMGVCGFWNAPFPGAEKKRRHREWRTECSRTDRRAADAVHYGELAGGGGGIRVGVRPGASKRNAGPSVACYEVFWGGVQSLGGVVGG